MTRIDRRMFTAVALGSIMLGSGRAASAPAMTVYRDPSCDCCEAWVRHVRAAGHTATVVNVDAINAVKQRLGVPAPLRACHTAEIDGYLIEGHVPAAAIARLLTERPDARGLAVPGMPVGSPGMDVEGQEPATYDVMLFGAFEPRPFMRFRGGSPL